MSKVTETSTTGAAPATSIDELVLADSPERWSGLGFTVSQDCVQIGAVRVRLAGEDAGRGIVGWSLRGIAATELDGLPTTRSQSSAPGPPPRHANGISAIDHVVAMTPALDRSVRALQGAGLELRRIREQPTPAGAPRQAFFRLGDEILEMVQEPEQVIARHGEPERGARLWGLALIAEDLDLTIGALSGQLGEVRTAVQPGRRIVTLKRSAGLAVPVAVMSPRTRASSKT
jgi:hypothetical protein